MRLVVFTLALFSSSSAFAACEAPVSPGSVAPDVDRAIAAYANADVDGFYRATNTIKDTIPCLSGPIDRATAVRVHLILGARAFVDRNETGAAASFAAAKALDPAATLPASLAPPTHPMSAVFAAVTPAAGAVPVPAPLTGGLWFDGATGTERPSNRATIAQHLDGITPLGGSYLRPADPMFAYPVPAPEAPKRKATAWWVTAASAAAVSGGLYGLAAAGASQYGTAAYEDEAAIRGRTNGLVVASAGVGIVAVGASVGALVSGTF